MLEFLMAAGGRVVSTEELLERVWDEAANPFTAVVKVMIGRLRVKLGEPTLIETVQRRRLPDRGIVMDGRLARFASLGWLRAPRPTARLRLTLLYGALFLICGTSLLAISYLLVERATASVTLPGGAKVTFTNPPVINGPPSQPTG